MKFITLLSGVQTLTQEATPVLRTDLQTSINRTATTFATTGLTLTPGIGRYWVVANLEAQNGPVNASGEIGIFLTATGRTATYRQVASQTSILGLITVSTSNITVPVVLNDYIEITNASDTINVQYRSVDGSAFTLTNRSLFLLKV